MPEKLIEVIISGRYNFTRYIHTGIVMTLLLLLLAPDVTKEALGSFGPALSSIVILQMGSLMYLFYHNSIGVWLLFQIGSKPMKDYLREELNVIDWMRALRLIRRKCIPDDYESDINRTSNEINIVYVTGFLFILSPFRCLLPEPNKALIATLALCGLALLVVGCTFDLQHSNYVVSILRGLRCKEDIDIDSFLKRHKEVEQTSETSSS